MRKPDRGEPPKSLEISLGQSQFLGQLRELVTARAALIPGARVDWKRNRKGELVMAVICPDPPFASDTKR
jgi:hypothetical protein